MNAASYGQLQTQQANLNCAFSNFNEAKTFLLAYRNTLQTGYHAKEQQALLDACNVCIERLQQMMNHCSTLKEQLIYYERMRL